LHVGIDDFGTGYSSLSYLHRFPIDTLKIDRSFVNRLDQDEENSQIVQTIVSLAHHLKMDVIAEGVETAAQQARLTELACEYGQGFYFSRPVEREVAEQLIAANRSLAR
jgi:EAL domain-containing protein (putative c-di-GMP-specific phosphodiesterase class I)